MPDPNLTPARVQIAAHHFIHWYWSFGLRRTGQEALGLGSWLATAYSANKGAAKIASRSSDGRRTMALWGPSQAGKSTLLSGFLDREAGDRVSALQWDESRPVKFVGASEGNTLRLNPHNLGSDASGCVTRFVSASEVDNPQFPVEFVFADPDQLLQAIAIGYITECEQESGVVAWDEAQILRLLDAIPVRQQGPDRDAFELLHDFTTVVDDLILARWQRYRNLAGRWTRVKTSIFECAALVGSIEQARRFIGKILWDDQARLTDFYTYLVDNLKKYKTGHRRYFASYDLTRYVLNISTGETVEQAEIRDFCSETVEDNVYLGSAEGTPIATTRLNFATFQALIWEVKVPVNSRVLESTAPKVAAALEKVDILDFPGVSQQGVGGTTRKVADIDRIDMFTKVLKRGKTASIVVGYGRTLGIDAFSMLIRMQNPVPQPDQLIAGLTAWCIELGHDWPPSGKPPPLNIVLTFSAKLINAVAGNQQHSGTASSLGHIFNWFDSIRTIADPRWAHFWTISYPQFGNLGEGAITVERERALQAVDLIMSSPQFQERFSRDPKGLERMARASFEPTDDGGIEHFLSSIPDMVAESDLGERREKRLRETFGQLQELAEVALPGDIAGSDRRKADIAAWRAEILKEMENLRAEPGHKDGAATIASDLLAIGEIDPETLQPIPPNAENRDLRAYVFEQVRVRWLTAAKARRGPLARLGLESPADSSRRLSYLAEEVAEYSDLADWIKVHLGQISHPEECKHARRFLALRISDLLLFGKSRSDREHRALSGSISAGTEVDQLLNQYAAFETSPGAARKLSESPHYDAVVVPFFSHIEVVASRQALARRPQPGDPEMSKLIQENL